MIPLHLPHRVVVRRMVRVGADPYGNDELAPVPVTVAAHVQTGGNTASPTASLRRAPLTMFVAAETAIGDGDEIDWSGRTFRVMGDATYQLDILTGHPAYGEVELEAVS